MSEKYDIKETNITINYEIGKNTHVWTEGFRQIGEADIQHIINHLEVGHITFEEDSVSPSLRMLINRKGCYNGISLSIV